MFNLERRLRPWPRPVWSNRRRTRFRWSGWNRVWWNSNGMLKDPLCLACKRHRNHNNSQRKTESGKQIHFKANAFCEVSFIEYRHLSKITVLRITTIKQLGVLIYLFFIERATLDWLELGHCWRSGTYIQKLNWNMFDVRRTGWSRLQKLRQKIENKKIYSNNKNHAFLFKISICYKLR